jgi:16S rRNA processing protein RimM
MSISCVGVATKPQALKGQFRIKPEINNFKIFKKLDFVVIDNKEYNIESVSIRDAFVIVKLEGIDTCEQAEAFRNKKVFAEIELQEVETHFDLVGFSVIIDNEEIGEVVEINNYGSKDILSISGKDSVMLPIIDGLIKKTNEQNKQLILNKEIFEQVAVYEN